MCRTYVCMDCMYDQNFKWNKIKDNVMINSDSNSSKTKTQIAQ